MKREIAREETEHSQTVTERVQPEWLYVEWLDGSVDRFYIEDTVDEDDSVRLCLVEPSFRHSTLDWRETFSVVLAPTSYSQLNTVYIKSCWTEPVGFEIEWAYEITYTEVETTYQIVFGRKQLYGTDTEREKRDVEVVGSEMTIHGDPDCVDWPERNA